MSKELIGKIIEASNAINKSYQHPSGSYIVTNKSISDTLANLLVREKAYTRISKIKKILNTK